MVPIIELLQWSVIILTIIANLSISVVVFKINPRSATHRLISLLSIITVFWTVFNYLALLPGSEDIRLFWVRTVMFFTTPYGTVILLLSLAFPQAKLDIKKKLLYGLIAYNIFTASLAYSPYMFSKLENLPNGSFTLYPGPGILVYAIGFMGFMGFGFVQLIRKYKKSTGIIKKQLQLFIFGIIISFSLLTLTNFIAVTVFRTIQYTAFGPPFTLIMFGFTVYAIVKHRFLDIKFVIARSLAYTLLVLLVGLVFANGLFIAGTYIIDEPITLRNILFSTILAFIIAFSFHPLRRFLEKTTDSIFYKDRYDSSKLLYDLAIIMASTNRLEDLTHQLLKKILGEMRISKAAFILTEKDHIYEVAHEGYTHTPEFDEKVILTLLSQPQTLVFEEIQEGEIKQLLRQMDVSIVLHLRTEGEQMGLLTLREKLSGDIYTDEDIRVLETLTHEAAVAIQNAKAYEEIRRFSGLLQKEINEATKELQDANKRLREVDELKDEFVSIASHELRTPMTAIKSYLWMVLNRSDRPLGKKTKRNLERAYHSTEQLIKLVQDMLTISRIGGKRLKLEFQDFNYYKLVKQVYEELKVRADEKEIIFVLNTVSKDIKQYSVHADNDKVKEVLVNIIGNALKFTPAKGEITVKISQKNDMIETNISDTGPGIKKEDMPKLFQKFARFDHSYTKTTPDTSGTGLGLYICKQIISLHHGKIWADSQVDKGTTFTFTLPKA